MDQHAESGSITVVTGEICQGHDELQLCVLVMQVTCFLPQCL